METLLTKLTDVLSIITQQGKINTDTPLLTVTKSALLTPVGDMHPLLTRHKSKLPDQFVEKDLLVRLVEKLAADKHFIRLDHIGFCYKVDPLEAEKERLINAVKKTPYHLYQEPSNDEGLWLFLGDIADWQKPVLEFVPIQSTADKWADYWLPHIQIDIDTDLAGSEIVLLVKQVCGKAVYPFSITIGREVCIVRNRLGTLDGVNITLDLATTARDVKALREKVWEKIA